MHGCELAALHPEEDVNFLARELTKVEMVDQGVYNLHESPVVFEIVLLKTSKVKVSLISPEYLFYVAIVYLIMVGLVPVAIFARK